MRFHWARSVVSCWRSASTLSPDEGAPGGGAVDPAAFRRGEGGYAQGASGRESGRARSGAG